jgi:hypothetical protein
MKIKRKTWLIIAFILCVVLYFCIPVSILIVHYELISYTGSFLVIICLALFIFSSPNKLIELIKAGELPFRMYLVPVLLFIGSTLILVLHYESLISKDTMKNGVCVTGRIISGDLELKTNGNYNVKIEYTTLSGKTLTCEKTIASTNERLYVNKELELYYSKYDSSIVTVIDHETITEFLHIEDREIKFADLVHLLGSSKDSIGIALNNLNYKWTNNSTNCIWYNKRKSQAVEVQTGKLIYTTTNLNYEISVFNFEIEELGYKSIKSEDKNRLLYSKDNMNVEIKQIEAGIISITLSKIQQN